VFGTVTKPKLRAIFETRTRENGPVWVTRAALAGEPLLGDRRAACADVAILDVAKRRGKDYGSEEHDSL
jgi:hypothetical protein